LSEAGLAIGLELAADALRIAVSVGGNAELVRGGAGSADFLPASTGYDDDGFLTVGTDGLADISRFGAAELLLPDGVDGRGADVTRRLAVLVGAAHRRLMSLLRRPVSHAVLVLPPGLGREAGLVLMQAVEAAGLDVLNVIDAAEAAAAAAESVSTDASDPETLPVLGAALIAEEMRPHFAGFRAALGE
jgi:hypothetical protein